MSVDVASVTHIDDLDIEHAIADLLQLWQDLGLHLKVHPCATVGVDVAHHPQSLLDLFALLATQVLILDIVASGLVLQGLEVVGGVLLHKLAVDVGRVLEPDMSVLHVLLAEDGRLVLVMVLHAALGAALDGEDVLRLELLLLLLNLLEHLRLDLLRL